jgi:hypothetical protein
MQTPDAERIGGIGRRPLNSDSSSALHLTSEWQAHTSHTSSTMRHTAKNTDCLFFENGPLAFRSLGRLWLSGYGRDMDGRPGQNQNRPQPEPNNAGNICKNSTNKNQCLPRPLAFGLALALALALAPAAFARPLPCPLPPRPPRPRPGAASGTTSAPPARKHSCNVRSHISFVGRVDPSPPTAACWFQSHDIASQSACSSDLPVHPPQLKLVDQCVVAAPL